MRIGICPGSFDPVTNGHIDIFERGSQLVDKLIVAVFENPSKKPLFSMAEREEMLRETTKHIPNIEVVSFHGLLNEYAIEHGATIIIRGLRALSDFEYEFQMALINRKLNPACETIFLTTRAENMYLSSSIVKQVSYFGGDIENFVPHTILGDIQDRLNQERRKDNEH